jgi:2-methylisocitrate lyase-like PEP mutase family enzyme
VASTEAQTVDKSPFRTDDYLEAILAETGNWVVNGPRGEVLCMAASLNQAIERAAACAGRGAEIMGLSRLPPERIFVSGAQVERLKQLIAAREVMPLSD